MAVGVNRVLIIGWLCLGSAGAMQGQQADEARLPDAPAAVEATTPPTPQKGVVFHKKLFWTLVGVDAASAAADVQTSWHNEQEYPNGYELNSWLYGRRPSLARYYATDAAIDGGGAFLGYKLLHSRRRLFRMAGWALLVGLVGQHTAGWSYNLSVR